MSVASSSTSLKELLVGGGGGGGSVSSGAAKPSSKKYYGQQQASTIMTPPRSDESSPGSSPPYSDSSLPPSPCSGGGSDEMMGDGSLNRGMTTHSRLALCVFMFAVLAINPFAAFLNRNSANDMDTSLPSGGRRTILAADECKFVLFVSLFLNNSPIFKTSR